MLTVAITEAAASGSPVPTQQAHQWFARSTREHMAPPSLGAPAGAARPIFRAIRTPRLDIWALPPRFLRKPHAQTWMRWRMRADGTRRKRPTGSDIVPVSPRIWRRLMVAKRGRARSEPAHLLKKPIAYFGHNR